MGNSEFVVARTREELIDYIRLEKGIIWDSSQELYEVLDDLRDVGDRAKYKATICKNVRFSGPVEYKGKQYRQILDMAEVLPDIKDDDDIVFLNNNIKEALEFVQQCINIDKHPNVYLKEDVYKRKVLDNIDKNYHNIVESAQNLLKFMSELKIKPSYKESFDKLKNFINNIVKELKAYETKVLKVVVFATKKSGKSMVVNALLGEEYAPTSLEIPTPCVVKYVPVDGIKKITVEYGKETQEFNRPEDVREWIGRKFKEVNRSGNRLEDIIVKYPLKEGINYLIYDTPGPDLAGSQHDVINEILPDVDVAVFVIDYSKYAQKSEEELLKRVKQHFGKSGKKHSFICLINKIDLMLDDTSTEKIKVRVNDFIYKKFKDLLEKDPDYKDYNELIVIPGSAMTYFYLKKLTDVFGNDIIYANDIRRYLENREDEIDEKDEYTRTLVGKIQNVANSIRQTYRKKEVGYQDVLQFSNFENFKKYLYNVTQRKARLEKGWASVIKIEEYLNTLTTIIRNDEQLVSEQVEKIRAELEEFLQNYNKLYLAGVKEELDKQLKLAENEIVDIVRRIIEDGRKALIYCLKSSLDRFIHEIGIKIEIDAESLRRGEMDKDEFIESWSSIDVNPTEILQRCVEAFEINFEKGFEERLKSYIQDNKQSINQRFKDIQNKLEYEVERLNMRLNKILNRDLNTYKQYFTAPSVQLEFNEESFKESLIDSVHKICEVVRNITVSVPESTFEQSIKGGFFRRVLSPFGIMDRYKVDVYSIREKLLGPIEREFLRVFNEYSEKLSDALIKQEREFEDKVRSLLSMERERAKAYIASVEESIRTIKNMLEKEEDERKEIYELINKIKQNKYYISIINKWHEIYHEYYEYSKQNRQEKLRRLNNAKPEDIFGGHF